MEQQDSMGSFIIHMIEAGEPLDKVIKLGLIKLKLAPDGARLLKMVQRVPVGDLVTEWKKALPLKNISCPVGALYFIYPTQTADVNQGTLLVLRESKIVRTKGVLVEEPEVHDRDKELELRLDEALPDDLENKPGTEYPSYEGIPGTLGHLNRFVHSMGGKSPAQNDQTYLVTRIVQALFLKACQELGRGIIAEKLTTGIKGRKIALIGKTYQMGPLLL